MGVGKIGVRNMRERQEHNPWELRSCPELRKGSSASELHPWPETRSIMMDQ